MKIARVSSWVLRVPFRYPLLDEDTISRVNFVEIETEDGIVGHAMSQYPLSFAIREFINTEVAPAITGMDIRNIEAIRQFMSERLGHKFVTGVFACANSLIDVAMWDIKGKATNQPIWQMLGGARSVAPVYITFGLPGYTEEQLIEVARILIDQGQTRLKMVVGSEGHADDDMIGAVSNAQVDRDVKRVRALREAVGPDIELMIDANKNFTLAQARRLATQVEEYDLIWFEDPVPKADPRLMAKMRESTSIPIAAGSTGTSDLVFLREYLVREAVDYLQPNVRDIGGFTGGLKAAALAESFNINIEMGGNWPHMNMHLHAGVFNGGRVEFHWGGWQQVKILCDNAPDPDGGNVVLPDRPGLGFTPKEGIVKEYGI